MKGLDDHIEGNHSPQLSGFDFVHTFNPVINLCDWITEEMWDDDKTLSRMENILWEILEKMTQDDPNIMSKITQTKFIETNAQAIADQFTKRMKD